MSALQITLAIVAAYLAAGVLVTILLSRSPYSNLPWWQTTLLWPFWLIWG